MHRRVPIKTVYVISILFDYGMHSRVLIKIVYVSSIGTSRFILFDVCLILLSFVFAVRITGGLAHFVT